MFEVRRRRAAKLTHFFGVHYRELIRDVLDSIEKGVVDESRQGNLQPEEAEVSVLRRKRKRTRSHDHGLVTGLVAPRAIAQVRAEPISLINLFLSFLSYYILDWLQTKLMDDDLFVVMVHISGRWTDTCDQVLC